MQSLYFILSTVVVASLLTGCAGKAAAQARQEVPNSTPTGIDPMKTHESVSGTPSANCPVTVPQEPSFTPPPPYDTLGFDGDFWYGTNSLWTAVPENGVWPSLPGSPNGYTQKIFWWREGYVWTEEPEPDLVVTGERLDGETPTVHALKATNAYAADIGSAMLTGLDFPTRGCWKITGNYKDTELSFVVWIAP